MSEVTEELSPEQALKELPTLVMAMAQKAISFCENEEELNREKKLWMTYFNLLNKFLAGKGGVPYFSDNGKIEILK